MKKYLMIFAFVGLFSLTACQNNGKEKEEDNASSMEQQDQQITEGSEDVPQLIIDKINNDNILKTKKIKDSRSFYREGITYYELSFEGNDTTKVVYDELGNRVDFR